MFQGLKRIVYQVSDLAAAKQWYKDLLGKDPVLDSPAGVAFVVGDAGLVLTSAKCARAHDAENITIAYWAVEDIDAAYKRLVDSGATPKNEISMLFNSRLATVIDPFGNTIGLIGKPADTGKRSVEEQPSETAMSVASMRALAALDEREEIRGHDSLAAIFLTEDRKIPLRDPAMRAWVLKKMVPPGVYEYMLARTVYFDHVVSEALREDVPQIIFLGAGYDSRACRFRDLIKSTRIFELDIRPTQERKKKLLCQANVVIPEQLTFVPINFNKDTLHDILLGAGFDKTKKSLFIWEGVMYYLDMRSIDDTLAFITSHAPAGSSIAFDYSAYTPDSANAYGVRELRESVQSTHPGEPIKFRLPAGTIETFLKDRGLTLIDHMTAPEMEQTYLTLRDGSSAGKVPPVFSFARAAISPKEK